MKKYLVIYKFLFAICILSFCLNLGMDANADEIYLDNSITTPYLLNQANKTYVLTSDITADQTAFVVKGNNITLDLNGHTVTFNNGNAVEIPNRDFENWTGDAPDNWTVLAGTPQKSQSIFFGNYDLVFSSNGGKIRSAPVTLKANKTYLAFAFIKGAYENVKAVLRLLRASDGEILKSWESVKFDSGCASKGNTDSDLIYKPESDIEIILELECIGVPSFRIGMVDIKPALDYGVIGATYQEAYVTPDIPANYCGNSENKDIVIKNGQLIQGFGKGVRCLGVRQVGTNWKMLNLEMDMNGMNTGGISAAYLKGMDVENCSIKSTSESVFNRMHMSGSAGIFLGSPAGDIIIKNNLIDGVPQLGIAALGNPAVGYVSASYLIENNVIRQREVVTEGYAIGLGGGIQNALIANNIIEPYQGRGIMLDTVKGANKNIIIRDNQILNLYEVRNPEYNENGLECAGIRIRNWGGTTPMHENIKIYGNTITGHTDSAGVHAVYGININASALGDSIEIYDNTIEVTAEGSGRLASAITFQSTNMQGDSFISIHNNTLKTNSAFLRFGGNYGADAIGLCFENNDFIRLSNPTPIGNPFIYGYWTGKAKNNIFVNNTGIDAKVKDNFIFNECTGERNLIIGRHRIDVIVKGTDS